jgi:chromosome segregation ATPase
MKIKERSMKWMSRIMLVVLAAMGATGCLEMDGDEQEMAVRQPATEPRADYMSAASVESLAGESSALDSALEWSQKYAQAMEKVAALQEANSELSEKRLAQQEELKRLKQDLAQAQRELSDANATLREMKAELDRWKSDVLGFRSEMRKAQQAQMIALRRVLMLLGGEMPKHTNARGATK